MKILFFGIQYHNYTRAIIDEMTSLGGKVTFVDLQPRSVGYKVIRTLARASFERIVRARIMQAITETRSTAYDKVVFLQAHQMPLDLLEDLRDFYPQAEFTLYNWDAITTHDYRPQAAYFDRVLTFDRRDAATHGYGYLPLFCIRRWQELARNQAAEASIYMVGNIVRLERYHAVEEFRNYCATQGLKFREHLKISPVVLAHAARQGVWPRGVSIRPIAEAKFAQIIETSLAAFDFANHTQSGQTMRMIESLCAGKKIITNNQWVKLEPFYSPDRIHVFEGLNFSGVADFLETPVSAPEERFPAFHIQNFVRTFLGLVSIESSSRHLRGSS
jgi:hypothetical protein